MADGAATDQAPASDWTCSRCDVNVSWMAEVERPALPATWVETDGELYCLGCQREMAGEAGLERAPDGATSKERQQIESQARIEFEIRRRPDLQDNRIASACKTSVVAVQKTRARLGMTSQQHLS